jgi:two-component system sensor histidine kinase KdpD
MLAECDRLSRLVHNVLSVAKLERGQLPVLLETLDPLPLLTAVADRFAPRLDSVGYTFEVVLPNSLPVVRADRDGMDQIVSNLLDNAAKYGRGTGGRKDLIRLEAVADEGFLRIAVVDLGSGVKPGEHEKIFGQFFRSPSAPREIGGAGLGLAIARAVARAAGGDLRYATSASGGARFELNHPLAEDAP